MLPEDWKKEIDQTISEPMSTYAEAQNRSTEVNREIASRVDVLANELERYNAKQKRDEPSNRCREILTVGGLIATALFTLALAGFSLWQVIETRRAYGPIKESADVALKVQQPYIFIPAPKFSVSPIPDAFSENQGQLPVPHIEYTLQNDGLSSATVRFSKPVAILVNRDNGKETVAATDDHPTLETFVISKGESRRQYLPTPDINSAIPKQFPEGKIIVLHPDFIFWVEIQNFDIFGYLHTSIRWFYAPVGKEGVGAFHAVSSEEYESRQTEGQWVPDLHGHEPPYVR